MQWRRLIFSSLLTVGLIMLGGWLVFSQYQSQRQSAISGNQLAIVTSFYPLAFFAQQVGGDQVVVTNLTPSGAEPHDYELTPQDLATITRSKLLILNGGNLEVWGDKVKDNLRGAPVTIVTAGTGVITQSVLQGDTKVLDPHVWLDPVLAQTEVHAITVALVAADPAHTAYYQANEQRLLTRLQMLNLAWQQGLQHCSQSSIFTAHAAFGYLANRYGFTQVALTGLSPDAEPSPQRLAEITQRAKSQQVRYIFFESLVSPRLAETLAREVGAQTLLFNPLEGLTPAEQSAGADYFSIMRDNLEHVKMALGCS
jgi:zinc transport system substrate-binding protein